MVSLYLPEGEVNNKDCETRGMAENNRTGTREEQ